LSLKFLKVNRGDVAV